MAISSTSSVSSASAGVWQQLQTQQALRTADQAEQKARALRAEAAAAQTEADRAQDRARNLRGESSQAQTVAEQARRGVSSLESVNDLKVRLSDTYVRIGQTVQAAAESAAPAGVSAVTSTAPVVATAAVSTGTLINTTA